MSKEWRKALLQWTEPDGVTWHQIGDVYQIDTDVVFDDADLLRIGTHVPATDEEVAAVKSAKMALEAATKPAKASKVEPPTESEAQ